MIKTATKIIKIENENKNTMKKIITANMTTTKKKENDDKNRKQRRKEKIAKHNKRRIFEKS